jgi:hypothetical protein
MEGHSILLKRMLPKFSDHERSQIEHDVAKLDEEMGLVRDVLSERRRET